jgi:phospholipid transport system substrate-binding protein
MRERSGRWSHDNAEAVRLTMRSARARCGLAALVVAILAFCSVYGSGTCSAAAPVVGSENPAEVIASVARTLLPDIDAHRDQYTADSAHLDNLVRTVVLPHFDSELAARLVLARHWDDASVTQRQRFIDAFYHLLLHNFGADLTDISLDRLQVLPYRGDPAATYATVETVVRRRDGDIVHINYSMHRTQQGWKVFDVAIDGISYLASFRPDFAEEIEHAGLDELIGRLERVYGRGEAIPMTG